MDYYEIGQRIRKFRKAHRLSQEELAERINISNTHMSHIETGNTKLSLQVLVDIAKALNVRTDDLLNDTAESTPSALAAEVATIFDGCTAQQALFLAEHIKATKLALDKYLL